MLSWAITFTIFALSAAALGFGHAASSTGVIAKTCLALFIVLSLVRAVSGDDQGARPKPM
ncbi:MAG TPA: DUF1328 domain-containing protein [Deltaproteobacteria bacterium]|nr:DUF1328 domain-containing protein [Deltaproteobacteria bacterium]